MTWGDAIRVTIVAVTVTVLLVLFLDAPSWAAYSVGMVVAYLQIIVERLPGG